MGPKDGLVRHGLLLGADNAFACFPLRGCACPLYEVDSLSALSPLPRAYHDHFVGSSGY